VTEFYVILITAPSDKEAESIAQGLLEARLIACANVIPGLSSLYWWEGKLEQSREVLLLLKAPKENFETIKEQVKQIHSYIVPEIIALPVLEGDAQYLDWITKVTVKA
jgi:periplasmic divalent cation tolerance protein